MSVELTAMSPLKQIMKGSSANSSAAENLLLVETNQYILSSPTSKDFVTPSCTFCCDCGILPQRLSPVVTLMVGLKGLHCTSSSSGLSGDHALLYEQSQETKTVQKVNM